MSGEQAGAEWTMFQDISRCDAECEGARCYYVAGHGEIDLGVADHHAAWSAFNDHVRWPVGESVREGEQR